MGAKPEASFGQQCDMPFRFASWFLVVGLVPAGGIAAAGPPTLAHDRGKALFERHCAVCHGTDGSADTPVGHLLRPRPRDFTDPVDMARVTVDRMYRSITEGRPGTAMAAWKQVLGEIEIGDVIDYIHDLSASHAKANMPAQQLSLEVGKRIYERECAYCHGLDRRANTAAAKVLDPPPRNFADPVAMARLDDGRMYMAIYRGRPGTAMGGRGEQLAPPEIIDVMRYVRTLVQPLPGAMTPGELDLEVGGRIFAQYCAPCHSARGDARTPLAAHLSPPPRDFTNVAAMAAMGDEQLASSIVHGVPGTAMAPWDGVLSKEDVRRVVLYIRRRLARP